MIRPEGVDCVPFRSGGQGGMQFIEWLRQDDPELAAGVAHVLDLRAADREDQAAALPYIKDIEQRLQGAIAVWEAERYLSSL